MVNVASARLVGSAQLRVALAVVFFLVSSLQGTLFASAGSFGQIEDRAAVHHAMAADQAAGDHKHEGMADATVAEHHGHGEKPMSDDACEVHCAAASAVPVPGVDIAHVVARCFALAVPAVLADGNYAECIRPPRQLT